MSCCKNPEYTSSTYSDECMNCGWYFNYMTEEEGYNYPPKMTLTGGDTNE